MANRQARGKSAELAQTIKNAISEKKGEEIVLLNLKPIKSAVCDYFIICTGNSNTHVSSIAEEIEKEVKHIHHENVYQKEGYQNAEWILLDYADVVVHVFQKEARSYYNLEGLWADAKAEEAEMEY